MLRVGHRRADEEVPGEVHPGDQVWRWWPQSETSRVRVTRLVG